MITERTNININSDVEINSHGRQGIIVNLPIFFLKLLIILTYFYPVATLMPSYIQIPVFVLWAVSCSRMGELWSKAFKLSIINIIVFIFTLFRCIAAGQLNTTYYSTFQVVIQRYQFLIFPILFLYVNTLDKRHKRKIFKLCIFSIFITLIFSLYYIFFVDPQAIRNTQRDFLWGVGDFALMYADALLAGPLLFLMIEKKKNKQSIINLLVFYVVMLLTIALCNLVTSVVVAAISIFVTYCVSRKRKILYILISIISGIAFALRGVLANLLYSLASKEVFYWSTNNKIIAIANILAGVATTTNVDTITRRFMLAGFSINSFLKHPLMGINWSEHQYGTIGCHMQWADDLGRYGILGNLIIIPNYIYIAVNTIKMSHIASVKDYMISAWIVFLILGFLNPNLSGTTLMAMFVIIPCMDAIVGDGHEIYNYYCESVLK